MIVKTVQEAIEILNVHKLALRKFKGYKIVDDKLLADAIGRITSDYKMHSKDVCPKCGSGDVIVTVYCNKCNEAM